LEVSDVTGLDTSGLWESDGTDVWWLLGNIGAGIATPSTLLHLGQADGASPDFGTKARGLQFGQSPLGNLNIFQNTSNEFQFTIDDVNKFKIAGTGPILQDTVYANDYYINDSTMNDYIIARKSAFAAAGSNNEIQLNRLNVLSASSGLTWNDTTLKVLSSIGTNNLFIGDLVGASVLAGASNNTFVGSTSGGSLTTGDDNTFLGVRSGFSNVGGTDNVFVGHQSGDANASGDKNTFVGTNTGFSNITGIENTYVGYSSGQSSTGSNNVFLGHFSGFNETGSDKLYIDNSATTTPLIYGEFDNNYVKINDSLEVSKSLKFSENTAENYAKGKLYYDTTDQSLTFFNDQPDFTWQIGREVPVRFFNNTGSTITNGTLLTSLGAKVNGSITFTADLAGIGSLDSLQGVAMATVDVLDGEFGEATLIGQVNGLNTSAFNDNDLIFADHNGGVRNTSPDPPLYSAIVGRVVYADADSGAIYMFPVGETQFSPSPAVSVSFTRESETITNPGINTPELITNGTGDLYTEDYNVGFTVDGDTISPLQGGVYAIDANYAYQGDAASADDWRVGVFLNGVEQFSVLRTSSASNKGVVGLSKILTLTTTDWVSFKVENTTNATRDAVFTDGVINIEFVTMP
jgi:hypothetical protein